MFRPFFAVLMAAASVSALAQNAPGVDPFSIPNPGALRQMMPGPALPKPQPGLGGRDGILPPGQSARMARFEAKVMTLEPDSMLGSEQAREVSLAAGEGLTKVCAMDIGSATNTSDAFNRYGPGNNTAQPVVIRGAVINICR